jgi:flagellar basal-body rod modification protein FlgD
MTTAIDTSVLQGLGLNAGAPEADKNKIGQEQFLKLMTTQMQNQDPFKPMENGDFLGQIAQFSTVSGIQDLQKSFSQFSTALVPNQGLQAAGLIDRNVLVPADYLPLNENGLNAAVELPDPASQVNVSVYNAAGTLVHNFNLGALGQGISRYSWDGTLADGSQAAAGHYKVSVDAQINGENIAVKNYADLPVESITFGGNGSEVNVNIRDLGTRKFSDILQIS